MLPFIRSVSHAVRLKTAALFIFCLNASSWAHDLSDTWKEGFGPLQQSALQWKPIRITKQDVMREWTIPGSALGHPVLRARCTTSESSLVKVYLQFLDAVPSSTDPNFNAAYHQLRKELPEALTKDTGIESEPGKAEPGAPAGAEVLLWETPELAFQLIFEPGKRVWMTIQATPEERKAEVIAKNPRLRFKLNIQKNEVGDVWLANLPSIPLAEANEDRQKVLEWLRKFYGWDMDDERIKLLIQANSKLVSREVFKDAAKATGTPVRTIAGFDFAEVQKHLDAGHPVIFVRTSEGTRNTFLMDFSQKRQTDPTLELPPADDPEEQKKWARVRVAPKVWVGAIVGYNAKRGEIIFSHPGWGIEFQNLRMRKEEAAVSTYDLTFFEGN